MVALKKGTYQVKEADWDQFCKDADEGGLKEERRLWTEVMNYDYWSHPAQDSFIFYYGTSAYGGFGCDIKGREHSPYKEYTPTPTNPNQELLDWAVENVEEWDEKWTHIRGSHEGFMYTQGDGWFTSHAGLWEIGSVIPSMLYELIWINSGDCNKTPQVITREEWLEAKPKEEEGPVHLTLEQVVEGLVREGWDPTEETVSTVLPRVFARHDPSHLRCEVEELEQQLKEKKKQLEEITKC